MKQPSPDARAYWQRLRKDKASNLAAAGLGVGAIAVVAALLAVVLPPDRTTDRSNPLYWLIIIPVGWWAASLGSFGPKAVRTMRPAMIIIPTLSAIVPAASYWRNTGTWLALFAFAVALAGSLLSAVSMPRSLVAIEGPDRR